MPIAKVNAKAPEFILPDMEGQKRSLKDLLGGGPVVLAFFKVECPICQYAFPFLERLHKELDSPSVRVIGISQDPPRPTGRFNREYGVRFPVLLDAEEEGYPVSNAYGITHVPSLFLIEPDGRISLVSVGFVKSDLEEIARRMNAAEPLFHRSERIEAFRPG